MSFKIKKKSFDKLLLLIKVRLIHSENNNFEYVNT